MESVNYLQTGTIPPQVTNIVSVPGVLKLAHENEAYLILALAEILVLFLIWVCMESRCGTTPGKWLCQCETRRLTLRPCGFAQFLVRDLFYWFDVPFFLTAIPCSFSMILSPDRQRIGDRLAGTIVVDTKSMLAAIQEQKAES